VYNRKVETNPRAAVQKQRMKVYGKKNKRPEKCKQLNCRYVENSILTEVL
jgi:hypothetical protein